MEAVGDHRLLSDEGRPLACQSLPSRLLLEQ